MIVNNINGTLQNKCKCGSWLQHWKNFSGRAAKVCQAKSCIGTDLVGTHVQKEVDNDEAWYIVPLCHSHNRALGSVELVIGAMLVAANKNLTCEKGSRHRSMIESFNKLGKFKAWKK